MQSSRKALFFPPEIWLEAFSYLPFHDIQVGVKPVSREFYHLGRAFSLHGLPPALWAKIFENLSYGDLKAKVQFVGKDFKRLIDNAPTCELKHQLFIAAPNERPLDRSTKVQKHHIFEGEALEQYTRDEGYWHVVYPWPRAPKALVLLPLATENATNPPATRIIVQVADFKPVIISHRRKEKVRAVTVEEVLRAVLEIFKTRPSRTKMARFLTQVGCRGCCFDEFWEDMLGQELSLVMRACDWDWFKTISVEDDGTVVMKINGMIYHATGAYDF